MNPIPVMVWTAQHDNTLMPKSLDDAERIADELLWQETESHNPIYDVYQTFAAEMLAWMDQQKIPQLGAQASLYSDLRSGGRLNATQFYFENFPRDHRPLYSQFLNLAQAHQLVVYDTAGPLVFLPDGSSMPAAARRQLAALTHMYQLEEQNRNIHDIPTRFDQVPDWLKAQVDANFAEYGFSECVIQIDDDGAIMGKAWKKTPAGLMILSTYVYERHGSLRVWASMKLFFKNLFLIKKRLNSIDFSSQKSSYWSRFHDVTLNVDDFEKKENALSSFFEKSRKIIDQYIIAFDSLGDFYDATCQSYLEKYTRGWDNYFYIRAAFILQPSSLYKIKDFMIDRYKLNPENFPDSTEGIDKLLTEIEPQYALLKSHGIPTLAADPAFYAEELGVEDLILKGFKLI